MINEYGIIDWCTSYNHSLFNIFTLEEFLEKFPYKVGDKVQHKGSTSCDSVYEVEKMQWVNNRVEYTIKNIWYNNCYYVVTAEDLQPYKEETMNKAVFDANVQCCDIMNHLIKKETMEEQKKDYEEWFQINYLEFENNDDTWADEVEVNLGKDYEIQIRGDKTFIVKKQPQYPKTYAECCRIIVAKQDRHYFYTKKDKEQDYPNEILILDQLDHLRMLIICRDAYWKITGDWRPDWKSSAIKYTIKYQNNNILKRTNEYINSILSFPTEEMRDAFYENFKSLIESCKELL